MGQSNELIVRESLAPETALQEEAVHALVAELDAMVAKATAIIEQVRELSGPQPGRMAGEFLTSFAQGRGHFIACRDTIKAMFRARNSTPRTERETPPIKQPLGW